MIRKVTGALLAAILANPFCCCLGGTHDDGGAQAADTSTRPHACCAGHTEESEAPAPASPRDDGPCDCDTHGHSLALLPDAAPTIKSPLLSRDHDGDLPAPALFTSIAAVPAPADAALDLPARSRLAHYHYGHSPGRAHAIAHGVYLI